MRATLDKNGRLLLPKALREALNLKPGDTLEVTLEEGHLVLTPLPPSPLRRKGKALVAEVRPESEYTVERLRQERLEALSP
ncbi:hypothetical protein YIM1640_18880 [Thermus oshimai]